MRKIIFCLLIIPSITFAKCTIDPWGKDAIIETKKYEKKEIFPPTSFLTKLANYAILFRQNVLTKIDGPRSNFRPTSSKYMQLAMKRYGFFRGFIMGCDRLMRENNDKWIYQSISIDGASYNYDPAVTNKFYR